MYASIISFILFLQLDGACRRIRLDSVAFGQLEARQQPHCATCTHMQHYSGTVPNLLHRDNGIQEKPQIVDNMSALRKIAFYSFC